MPSKATVVAKTPVVGVEFDPRKFQVAVTPEVVFPDQLDSLKITNLDASNAVINNVEFTGSVTGLPDTGISIENINDIQDVDASNPADLSILQYNTQNNRWVAVANTEFIDAVIDGGFADSESDYVDAFDIDGGNA